MQLHAPHFAHVTSRFGMSGTLTLPPFGCWSRKPTPPSATTLVVIRGVPLSTSETTAVSDIASSNAGRLEGYASVAALTSALKSATRLKRRQATPNGGSTWVASTSLWLQVDQRLGEVLLQHGHLVLGYRLHSIVPYEAPLRTCFHCGREGHVAKFCRSPPHCGLCGGNHPRWDCPHGPSSTSGVRGGTAPPPTQ